MSCPNHSQNNVSTLHLYITYQMGIFPFVGSDESHNIVVVATSLRPFHDACDVAAEILYSIYII